MPSGRQGRLERSGYPAAVNPLQPLVGILGALIVVRTIMSGDFSGWRVNYDRPLRVLERITMAPTPWWDRPMQSAWVTDEPDGAAVAEHVAQMPRG